MEGIPGRRNGVSRGTEVGKCPSCLRNCGVRFGLCPQESRQRGVKESGAGSDAKDSECPLTRSTCDGGIGRLAVGGPVRRLEAVEHQQKQSRPGGGDISRSFFHSFIQATLAECYYVLSTVPWRCLQFNQGGKHANKRITTQCDNICDGREVSFILP